MVMCPWCDEDAGTLLSDVDAFECTSCGTCVELVENVALVDLAA